MLRNSITLIPIVGSEKLDCCCKRIQRRQMKPCLFLVTFVYKNLKSCYTRCGGGRAVLQLLKGNMEIIFLCLRFLFLAFFFVCNSFSWWCVLCTYSSGFYGLRGQPVTGGISWGSSSGLVLLSSWECSRKQFSMQNSRISATQGNLVGGNCSLQFNWWGITLMAYAKLRGQMHIRYMITLGLFQNKEQGTRISASFYIL